MPKRYYKVVLEGELVNYGGGIGYEELFGDQPRYFWERSQAERRATELGGSVNERRIYDDGSFDDEDDDFARQQLDIEKVIS